MKLTTTTFVSSDTATVIQQYNEAFLQRAPEKLVDLIADDCVMEGVGPAPEGNVWSGYDECLAGWQALASDPTIRFEVVSSPSGVAHPGHPGCASRRWNDLQAVDDGLPRRGRLRTGR